MTKPSPINQPAPPEALSASGVPSGLRPGDKLDKYDVVGQIGAGGMSTVWKGHDRLLDRVVAIKELALGALGGDEQELRQRFRSEAQLQKRLAASDRHLVKVIDFIDDPGRGLFIVMEFIDGQSLEQIITKHARPMDRRKALGIIGATAMALESIHKQNVIHRDLKPSNILLPREGGLKVADFGVAAAVSDQNVMALGSVRYMAPELFRDEPVDARADLYSLGMIAYEMLAGRAKFNEAFRVVLRDVRNQPLRWMKWHTNPRAKATPLSDLNPEVPATLSDLVGRLMEKDPNLRVASAAELLSSMRRHFADAPPGTPGSPGVAAHETAGISGHELPGLPGVPGVPGALPVAPSSNPTAALPRRGRVNYILAAALALLLLGLAGMKLYQSMNASAALAAQAARVKARLNAAAETYKQDKFEDALADYQAIVNDPAWGKDPAYGKAARNGVLMSQGQIDLRDSLADKDAPPEAVKAKLDSAIAAFTAADELGLSSHNTIADLIREATNRRAFNDEVKTLEDMMKDPKSLGDADTRLSRLKPQSPYEQQVHDRLGRQVQGLMTQAFDLDVISQADKIKDGKGIGAAIAFLQDQLAGRPSNRVESVLGMMQREFAFHDLLDRASLSESTGRFAEALGRLNAALSLREKAGLDPGEDARIQGKITWLKGQLTLAKAIQWEKDNKLEAARRIYLDAQGYLPGNPQIEAALTRLKVEDQKGELLRAAAREIPWGQYAAAIDHLNQARQLDPGDQGTVTLLGKAEIKLYVDVGNKMIDKGDFDEARKALDDATRRAAADPEVQALDKRLRSAIEYKAHLDKGNEYARNGDYDHAKMEFLAARLALKTDQIEKLINDTDYDQLMAGAKVCLKRSPPDYKQARALLETIIKKYPTAEARKLEDDLKSHMAADPDDQL